MSESFNYDDLFSGDFPVVTRSETLLDGQDIERGAVLGKVTATGKLKIVNSGSGDGTENPYAVAAEASAPSGADATITVYLTGQFNEDKLTFGGADTIATHRVALRDLCIFAEEPITD